MMNKDYEWFLEHYAELFKQYGITFVAIKDAHVLGTYNSYGEAVRKTSEKEPLGSFIVQLCNGDVSGYTNYIASMDFCDA